MSPSTSPGESTKVTRLKRFCLDVQISVLKYSETPGDETAEVVFFSGQGQEQNVTYCTKCCFPKWLLTFEMLQRLKVRIQVKRGVPLWNGGSRVTQSA